MTERLYQALQHIEEIPTELQDDLATQIEQLLAPFTDRVSRFLRSFLGIMPDLPDDMEEELLRRRREVPPTPPMEEQLHWLDEE